MIWGLFALLFFVAAVVVFAVGWKKGQKTEAYNSMYWIIGAVVLLFVSAVIGVIGALVGGM